MSVVGQRQPPLLISSSISDYVWPHPFIPSSDSLEDGEIVEGRVSAEPQSKDQPPSKFEAATPAFRPATNLAPTAEPSMTKEDLDRAKSLVLDLLGWGVTPEYLVECGLSSGVIYRVFTDLQLRLPTNLEVSSAAPSHHGA